MTNTRFVERHGPARIRSTTRPRADLAKVAAALIRDYPEYYPLYSQKEFRYNNITQPNRNRLLWSDPHVDGMKTGHTDAAGWCLVATAQARRAAGARGRPRRELRCRARLGGAEAPQLGLPGVRHRAALPVGQAGHDAARLEGHAARSAAGFLADRYLTLPKGKADKLARHHAGEEPLVAPIARASASALVKVSLEGKPVAEFPMIALEDVPLASLLRPRLGYASGYGSRNRQRHGQRPHRLSQRQVPARVAGASLRARSRFHLRRRRVRAGARLRRASRSACRIISRGCSAASTASGSPTRTRTRSGNRSSASSSRASRSTTRACTSR